MAETKFGFQIGSSLATKYLTDAYYIRGTYLTVATIADRDALPVDSGSGGVIINGSLCYVVATAKFYMYNNGWAEKTFGVADFELLSNRPKYNGSYMTGSTNIPEVKTAYWDGKQPAGNYMTLDTDQTSTAKKTLSYTEPIELGGQETILNILSTRYSSQMNAQWCGRMKIGNRDKTFLLGVYRQAQLSQPAICGIGAHSWSDSFEESGPAWEDIYLEPDGNKAVFIGGKDWRANSGWFKVQNNDRDAAGYDHVYINRGSATSPVWRVVPVIYDSSTATNETWSAYKINSAINAKSTVSGTNDGTNWLTITINGTNKSIPTVVDFTDAEIDAIWEAN